LDEAYKGKKRSRWEKEAENYMLALESEVSKMEVELKPEKRNYQDTKPAVSSEPKKKAAKGGDAPESQHEPEG
jgi:cell division septation protein DedD